MKNSRSDHLLGLFPYFVVICNNMSGSFSCSDAVHELIPERRNAMFGMSVVRCVHSLSPTKHNY